MSENTTVNNLKDWLTFIGAVIACVAGVIFWVQSSNNPRFEKIEQEITILRQDIKNIRVGKSASAGNQIIFRVGNSEILRIVGRLEGKLEN